mmetsp:Transcript_67772/g.132931  ORF Transcript_67772/g.132931 Transcript_67772/m.132931 type:complete len:111 (-) Transcript_67772:98-430(-)
MVRKYVPPKAPARRTSSGERFGRNVAIRLLSGEDAPFAAKKWKAPPGSFLVGGFSDTAHPGKASDTFSGLYCGSPDDDDDDDDAFFFGDLSLPSSNFADFELRLVAMFDL